MKIVRVSKAKNSSTEDALVEEELNEIHENWKGDALGSNDMPLSVHHDKYVNKNKKISDEKKEQIRFDIRHMEKFIDVARKHNVSYATVNRIVREMPDAHEQYRLRANLFLADNVRDLSQMILDTVKPEDIMKASLRDKMLCFGILFDKMRLLQGESTENISQNVTDRELIIIATKAGADLPAAIKERISGITGSDSLQEAV